MTGPASTRKDRTDLVEIATAVAEAFVEETRQAATQDRFETIQGLDDEQKHDPRASVVMKVLMRQPRSCKSTSRTSKQSIIASVGRRTLP